MSRKVGSHAETTGPRVRHAAERLIARHGYAAVSMRRIAAEVGVQVGALYLYTPDKQTLLFDLLRDHLQDRLSAWADEVRGRAEDPAARLERFVRFHIRFHADRRDAATIAEMELRNLAPGNLAEIADLRARYATVLETILSDGVAAEAFRIPDTRLAATALLALLTGVATDGEADGRLGPDRIQRISWNIVRRAVGA
jgi:AcrR family transcriptional regulator